MHKIPLMATGKEQRNTNGTFEVSYSFKVTADTVLTGTLKTQLVKPSLKKERSMGKKFSYSISFNDMTI